MVNTTIYAVQESDKHFEDLTVFREEDKAIRYAVDAWNHLTDSEKLNRRIYVLKISGAVKDPNDSNELQDLAENNVETYDSIEWDSWEWEHEHISYLIEDELEKYMEEKHVVVKHSSGVECMTRHYIMQELEKIDDDANELTLASEAKGWVLESFMEDVDAIAKMYDWTQQRDKTYRLVYLDEGGDE